MHPDVEIIAHERAGVVRFREGAHVATFDWEFGGREVIVSIYVPAPAEWDAELPWAAGRRTEILETLGREVRRQRCRGCGIEIAERWVNLTEPPRLPRVWHALGRLIERWVGRAERAR
jgi:hypothetical protein